MAEEQPDTQHGDDELEITDLRLPQLPAGSPTRLPSFSTRAWQRVVVGLSLVLLVTILLANLLSGGGAVRGLSRTAASPTATQMAGPTQAVSSQLAPTVVPNSSASLAVGPAPARCSQDSPVLTADGNPSVGMAIGKAPVLVGGFVGPSATLLVGPAASARLNFPGWTEPYTRYGWPALIDLILHTGITGPVALLGKDVQTGYPLWFGFVVAGVGGAPQQVAPTLGLDPAHPAIPAGGEAGMEDFWFGYAFLPGAGCYTLDASWPGGSWHVTISAGAVNTGG